MTPKLSPATPPADVVKTTIYLPAATHRWLKVRAATTDTTITALVIEAVDDLRQAAHKDDDR